MRLTKAREYEYSCPLEGYRKRHKGTAREHEQKRTEEVLHQQAEQERMVATMQARTDLERKCKNVQRSCNRRSTLKRR